MDRPPQPTRLGTDVVPLNRPEVLAKVLAEHDWRWAVRESRTGEGVRIACTAVGCEWFADRDDTEDVWTAQRSHVAAALDAALAAQEGERGGAEVAAAIEAVLTNPYAEASTWTISRIRAALADPAGALATHDAEVLRAAADDFETDMARVWGGDASWLTTGSHIGQLVADVLREMASERADRIASGGQP